MDETSRTRVPEPASGRRLGLEARTWLICLLLALPAATPYATHYLMAPAGLIPTGFVGYDLPYYFANGREHFDSGQFRWTYGNPSDVSYGTARIYVQPLSLALGTIWRWTGLAPGVVFDGIGLLAALTCVRVTLGLYRHLVGLGSTSRWLGLVVFLWGGGLLAVAGIAFSIWKQPPGLFMEGSRFLLDPQLVFRFDPFGGLWFLNLGRNLIYPTEALYHAIFLGAILCLVREWYKGALALAALMCFSHPFTGIELVGVLGTWSALEILFIGSRRVPRWFPAACLVLAAGHLGYYLGFLNQFRSHRRLSAQWTLDWGIDAIHFVPAYALVGGFAAWGLRRLPMARDVLDRPKNRLFLVWFLVAFAMANHEFAIRPPVQPIHFTRGYDWIPLFLLGLPTILGLLDRLLRSPRRPLRLAIAGAFVALFLADNALWFAYLPIKAARGRQTDDIYLSGDDEAVMATLNALGETRGLVATQDHGINYLCSVYTPLRSWSGHVANTPGRVQKQRDLDLLFETGRFLPEWEGETLLVAIYNSPENVARQRRWLDARRASKVLENPKYAVFRVAPAGTASRGPVGASIAR
jgi:hypothetical protein